MKTLILISAILIGHISIGQRDVADGNYGVSLKRVDSIDLINTTITSFDNSEVVVFPSIYATKVFGRSDQYKDVTFITPDTELVKAALTELNVQYCNALLKFNKRNWEQTLDIHKEDGLRKDVGKIKKQQKDQLDRHYKFCPQQQEQLKLKHKQIIAYTKASGDTILFIQTLDFRHDPYKLRPHFTTSWIDGWHGWFETNTMRFHYHADKKLLTVNEDL